MASLLFRIYSDFFGSLSTNSSTNFSTPAVLGSWSQLKQIADIVFPFFGYDTLQRRTDNVILSAGFELVICVNREKVLAARFIEIWAQATTNPIVLILPLTKMHFTMSPSQGEHIKLVNLLRQGNDSSKLCPINLVILYSRFVTF